jgi:hypothetical protein
MNTCGLERFCIAVEWCVIWPDGLEEIIRCTSFVEAVVWSSRPYVVDVVVPDIRVCCGRGWHRTSCRTTFFLLWVGWDLVRI